MISARYVVFVALMYQLSGCALSPQTVDLDPRIDPANISQRASDRTIALQVNDNRGTSVVGTRGGVYSSTSEISTSEDIKTPIRNVLAESLQAMGYRVVGPGDQADAELTVVVDSIDYTTTGENVVKSVETAATLRAIGKVGNREYTGRYRGKRTTEVFTAPDVAKNEDMINKAVSHVLERILADSELHQFMGS